MLLCSRRLVAGLGVVLLLAQSSVSAETVSDPNQMSYSTSTTLAGDGSGSIDLSGVNVIDFGQKSVLKVKGDFQNSGTLYAISTNPLVSTATIAAKNIFNNQGAIITTILPTAGLPGITDAVMNLNLVLQATNNIRNSGVISSAGSLTAIAGGSVTNAASSGIGSLAPLMSAMQNLNIQSSTLVNQGLISALANITIDSPTASDILVDNRGGTLQALLGTISVRDSLFSDKAHLVLWGGDVLSKEVNLYSGKGIVNVNVEDMTGVLNIFAGEAHVTASTGKLELGTINLTGDPTFFNTAGDVVIDTALVFSGAPLAIVASGNVYSDTGAGDISTSSNSGNAGDILIVAGADFDSDGPADALPPPPGDTTTTLTIYGGSISGGYIDLSSLAGITSLSAQSTGGNGNGGNITLVAFKGTNSGDIILPAGVTISTGGNGIGSNGDVTIISGSDSASAISIGGIDTSGGSGGGGNVFIATATPILPAGDVEVFNGAISNGASFGAGTLQLGSVTVGSITTDSADVTIEAGEFNLTGALSAYDFYLGSLNGDTVNFDNSGIITVDNEFRLEALGVGSNIIANNSGTISANLILVLAEDEGNFDFTNSGTLDANTIWFYGRLSSATPGSWTFTNTATGSINANNLFEWSGDAVSLMNNAGTITSSQINIHSHGIGDTVYNNTGTISATDRLEIATDNVGIMILNNSGTIESTAGIFDSVSSDDSVLTVDNTGFFTGMDAVQFFAHDSAVMTITNDGAIESSANVVIFASNLSLNVDGTGSVTSTSTVTAESATDSVSIVQGSINGTLTGSSNSSYLAGVTGSTLSVDSINVPGLLTLTSNGGDVLIEGNISGAPIQVNANNVTINGGVDVTSTDQIEFMIDGGGTFTNFGTVATTNGVLAVRSTAGNDLTIDGTGVLEIPGTGPFLAIESFGSNLTISGDLKFNTTANTVATFVADHDDNVGSPMIRFDTGAILTFTGDGVVEFCSSTFSFGNGSEITNNGSSSILFAPRGVGDPHGSFDVPIQIIVDAGSATVTTSGGPIGITPRDSGQNLDFVASGGNATLFLNGGDVTTTSNSANTTVDSDFTLSSDHLIEMNVNDGTLTNDGTITTSADASTQLFNAAQINVFSTGDLTLDGSGTWSVTAGSAGNGINLQADDGADLYVNSNYTFDTNGGATGFGPENSGGSIIFGDGSVQNVTSGTFNLTQSSIVGTTGGVATIQTSGGDIRVNFFNPASSPVQFSQTNPGGSNSTIIHLDGGLVTVTTTNEDQTIDAGVDLRSDNDITFTLNGSSDFTNNGTISNGSNDVVIDAAGDTINSPGFILTGALTTVSGNGGTTIDSTNATTLTSTSTGAVNITDTIPAMITVTASSATTFNLTATRDASGIVGTGAVNAGTVNLRSGIGGITFTGANSLNATTLSARSSGSVDLVDTANGTITLNTSNGGSDTGETFNLRATNGNITTAGTVSGNNILLQTTTGSIILGAAVTGTIADPAAVDNSIATIQSLGAGTITQTAGAHRVSANTVQLIGNTGNIGTSASPVRTTGAILNIQADATVYVSEFNGANVIGVGAGDFPNMGWRLRTENQGDITISDGIWTGGFFEIQTTGNSTLTFINNVPGDITALGSVLLVSQNIVVGSGTFISAGTTSTVTTSNLTVQATGEILSTGGDVNVNGIAGSALTIANNGRISAADVLTISNNLGVTINGTGTLVGTNGINVTSTTGAVSITQNTLTGDLSGSAGTSFTATTNTSGLSALDIVASNGNLSLTASTANLIVQSTGDLRAEGGDVFLNADAGTITVGEDTRITASRDVRVTSFGNLTVGIALGDAVTVSAGEINGGFNERSTNVESAGYDMTVFQPGGTIAFTSETGAIDIQDGMDFHSRGGNIELRSDGITSLGENNSFFAQGGNIWINADEVIMGSGQAFTAVGRYLGPGNGTVVIDGQTLNAFSGGGIAIYAGLPTANLDNEIVSQHQNRKALNAGYEYYDPGVVYTAGNALWSGGGSVEMIIPDLGGGSFGTIDVAGANFDANGGVVRVDPTGDIFIGGGLFSAFGPALVPFFPGGGGGGGGGVLPPTGTTTTDPSVIAPILSSSGGGLGAAASFRLVGGTIQPIDVTKETTTANTSVFNYNNLNWQCVPSQMAQSSQLKFVNGWSVAVGNCQYFMLKEGKGAMVVGSRGTELTQAGDARARMKSGKVVAAADKAEILVETENATVTVPSQSAFLIDNENPRIIRITNLSGQQGVVAIPSGDRVENIVAEPGQEVLVYQTDLEEEDLIPVDGLERTVVSAAVKIGSLKVRKNKLDTQALTEIDPLLTCFGGCFPVNFAVMQNKPKNATKDNDGVQYRFKDSTNYSDIAYYQPIAVKGLQTDELAGQTYSYNGSTQFKSIGPHKVELVAGELVVAAKQTTQVLIGSAIAEILPNSIAIVTNHNGAAKIHNVWDGKHGGVRAIIGGCTFAIVPGNEAVMASSEKQIAAILKTDRTARRRVNRFTLPDGQGILTSEVSLVSFLTNSRLMSRLMTSSGSREKQLRDKIAKMAVALSLVSSKHGNYSTTAKP